MDDIVDSRKPSQPSTLLELRKRAEYLNGKMHGGSLMICDVSGWSSRRSNRCVGCPGQDGLVARRLRGLEAKL